VFDRYQLFVDALDAVLRAAGVEVVGKATSRNRALELIDAGRADLVLVGLGGPGADEALDLIRRVRERWPAMRNIVVGRDGDSSRVEQALAAGATTFVAKGASIDDISFAIKQSFDHSIHFAADRARGGTDAVESGVLSDREVEILRLVAAGRSNGDVARELGVTEQTVKFHLSNIYRKLHVTNRTQASRRADELNLLRAVSAS
jgi:DNA-binding NarL/FixJ family response regulator